jgi:predicted DNA-binding antitoxin AbrB/MazE fold protein
MLEVIDMLVINGFIENGVFIPNQPIPIQERRGALLKIEDISKTEEEKRRLNNEAWDIFLKEIKNIEEELPDDFPIRMGNFRTPEKLGLND